MKKIEIDQAIKKSLLEAIKEIARIGLLAMVVATIDVLKKYLAGEIVEIDIKVIGIAGALAMLKSVDKFIHIFGKQTNDETLIKWLTRF